MAFTLASVQETRPSGQAQNRKPWVLMRFPSCPLLSNVTWAEVGYWRATLMGPLATVLGHPAFFLGQLLSETPFTFPIQILLMRFFAFAAGICRRSQRSKYGLTHVPSMMRKANICVFFFFFQPCLVLCLLKFHLTLIYAFVMSVFEMLHYSKSQFALLFINTPYISGQVDSSLGRKRFTSMVIYDSGVAGASAPTWPLAVANTCVFVRHSAGGSACLRACGCCAADGINR